MVLINENVIDKFSCGEFKDRKPFPWFDFSGFLNEEAFQALRKDFPPLSIFEYHENIYRKEQRPHNRYYLALDTSIYHKSAVKTEAGIIQREDLAPIWQEFIDELEEGEAYRPFIQEALGTRNYTIRYAWHMGKSTNEVSPHVDSPDKIGTHIFYFNTKEDWDPAWGGQLLVLSEKQVLGFGPNFNDFKKIESVSNMDNHSFLFKNTPTAWHGVKALTCPEGSYRKLFNVIISRS